ncbi:hypothetical protein M2175_003813 [Bradyrhizobium elkanii]|nr:hypothetical protein [Bradyrhizobium elkanii]MCS3969336.1 hypothetical protein [Bradyrhizobium japonicum]
MHDQTAQPQLTASTTAPEEKHSSVKGDRSRSVTLGFPAPRKHETKRVHFEPPLYARLVNLDGSEIAACEVTTVWETGAQLRIKCPPPFRFILQFAWSPTVVPRFCKRVRCQGEDVWVEYERQRPCYSLEYDR